MVIVFYFDLLLQYSSSTSQDSSATDDLMRPLSNNHVDVEVKGHRDWDISHVVC